MNVVLVMIDSVYQNSLALDYIREFALSDSLVASNTEIEVMVFSPEAEDDYIVSSILEKYPTVIGFSAYLWNINRSLTVASSIKTKRKDIVTVFGGVEVSYDSDKVLLENPMIDFIIEGEGEVSFRQLLKKLDGVDSIPENIPGLWFRKNGNVMLSASKEAVIDLNEIPSPFTSKNNITENLKENVLYESYRGCAYSCAFCLYHRNGSAIRKLSLERIEKDLRAILASNCKSIRFVDAMFNYDRKRTIHILNLLRGTDKFIEVEISAELLDDEMIELFASCGIRHVDVGLQTTERMSLTEINRKWYKPDVFTRNVRKLSSFHQMTVNIELIVGLPEDTLETFKISLDSAISHNPDHVSVYRLLLFKGNELRHRVKEYGFKYFDSPPYSLISSNKFPEKDLQTADIYLFAHFVLFNSGLGRWAMAFMEYRWNIRPTEIYFNFIEFCLTNNILSKEQMVESIKWYGLGNRFDRIFPKEFDIEVMKSVCNKFFTFFSSQKNDFEGEILLELIDYGFELAKLDQVEVGLESIPKNSIHGTPQLNDFCILKEYSEGFFNAINSKVDSLNNNSSNDLKAVAFFLHPKYRATAMALSNSTYLLLKMCDGSTAKEEITDRIAKYYQIDSKDILPEIDYTIEQMTAMNIIFN